MRENFDCLLPALVAVVGKCPKRRDRIAHENMWELRMTFSEASVVVCFFQTTPLPDSYCCKSCIQRSSRGWSTEVRASVFKEEK